MSINSRNFGRISGIVTPAKAGSSNALSVYPIGTDGAARIALAISVKDNFKSRVSKEELDAMGPEVAAKKVDSDLRMYKSHRITVGKYLPADPNNAGKPMNIALYEKLTPGTRVDVLFTVKTGTFVKDGVTQYVTNLEIESITPSVYKAPATATTTEQAGGVAPAEEPDETAFDGSEEDSPF